MKKQELNFEPIINVKYFNNLNSELVYLTDFIHSFSKCKNTYLWFDNIQGNVYQLFYLGYYSRVVGDKRELFKRRIGKDRKVSENKISEVMNSLSSTAIPE